MMIIVIGPDKSGKSTLVDMLAEHYKVEKYHGVYIKGKGNMLKHVISCLAVFSSIDIICDRFQYPEDLIYSRAIENVDSVFEGVRDEMDEMLIDNKSLILYMDTDSQLIDRRYKQLGGDDYVPIDKVEVIKFYYHEYFMYTKVPYVVINGSQTPHACFMQALTAIEHFREGRKNEGSINSSDVVSGPDNT